MPGPPARQPRWGGVPGPPARQPRWGGVPSRGHANPRRGINVSSGWGWGPSRSAKMIDQFVIPLLKIFIVLNATLVSVASIGVYGLILAGYASNSKYPLLASLRASAQLISYEVAVTLTLVSVIMVAGSLSMVSIVRAQESQHVWFAFIQPVAFVIFFIGGQ